MTSQSGIDIVTCGGETTVEAGTTEIESPFEAFPSEAIRLRPPPTARAILDAACSDPAFDRLGLDPCSSIEIFAGSGCAPEEIHRRELRELCVATVIGDLDEMAVFEIAPASRDTLRLACVTRQTFNPLPPHLQGLVMEGLAAAEPTHPNSASIGTSAPGGPSMSTGTAPSAAAGLTSIGSTALSKDTRDTGTLLSKATSTRDTVRDGVGFDVSAPQGVVLSMPPRALTGLLPCVGSCAEKATGSGDRDGKPPPVPPSQPQERGPSASAVAADGGVPIIPLMSPETPHFAPVDPSLLMSPPNAAKSDRDAVLRRGGALTLEEDSDGDAPRQGASRSGGGTLSIAVPNQCLEGSVGESSPRHRNPDYGGWTPKAGAQGASVTPTHQSSVLRRHPLGSLGSLSSSVAGKRSLPAVPSRSHTPTGADAARRRISVGSDGSVDFAVSSAAAVGALLSPASHGPVSPQAGLVSPSGRRTSETQTVLSLGASARRGSDRSRPRFNSGSFTLSQLRSDDAEPTVDVVAVPRTTAADAGDDQGFVFTDAGEGYITIVPWSTPELAVTTAPRGGHLTLAPAVASDPRQQFAMYIVGSDTPPTADGASSSATDPLSDVCSARNASDGEEHSSSGSPSSASSSSDSSSTRCGDGVEVDVETEQRLHGMTMYNATRWYQQKQQCTRPTGASTTDPPLVDPEMLRLTGCVKFVLSPRNQPDHVLVMGTGEARRGSSVSQPSAAAHGNELSLVAIEDASVDAAFVAVPKLTMEAAVARVRDEAEETARRDATLSIIGALDDASHFPIRFESSLATSPQNLDDGASVANEPKERGEDLMLCVACEDNVSSDTGAAGSLLTLALRSKPVQSQQQHQQFIPIDAGDGYVSFAPLCASDLLLTVDFLFAKDKKSVAPTGAQNTSVALSTSEVEDNTQESATPIPLSCLFSAADDPIGAADSQSEGPAVLRLQPSDIDGPRAEQQFEIVPFNQDLPRKDHSLRNKRLSPRADAGPRRCVLVPRSHPAGVVCCVASLESRLQAAIDSRSESADGSTMETAVVGRQKAQDRLDMIIAEKARVERMTQIRRDVGLLAKDFVANAGIVSILRQQLRTLEAESVVTDAADFAAALRPRLQVIPRSAVTGACVLSVVERDSLENTANIGSSHMPTVTVHADDETGIENHGSVWSQLLSGGLSNERARFDQVYELVPCAAPEHRVTFYHASSAVVVENRAEDPDPQLWEKGERSVAVFHRLRERSRALEKSARSKRQTRHLPTGGDRVCIPEDRSERARTLATLEPQKTSTGAVGPYHMPKVVTEEEERLLAARRLLAKMEAGRAAKLEARQRDAARYDAQGDDEVDQCVGGEDEERVCGQSTLSHAQATEEHWEHDVEDFRCFRPSSRVSYMSSSWAPCDGGSRSAEETLSIPIDGHKRTTAERNQRQRERDQLLGEALFVGGSKMTRVHGSTSNGCSPNLSRKSSFAVSTCSDAPSPTKSPSLRPLATNSEPSVRDGEGDALHRDVGVKAPAFESEAEAQAYHDGEEFLALDVSDRETLTRTQGVRILDVGDGYAAIVPCNAPHLALAMAAEHGHLRLGPVGQRGVTEAVEAHFEAVIRNDDDGELGSDDPGQDGPGIEKVVAGRQAAAALSVCLIPRQAARPLVVEVDYDAMEPRPFFDFLAGTKTALPKAPARPPRGPGLSLVSPEEASSYCDFMLIPRPCTPEK